MSETIALEDVMNVLDRIIENDHIGTTKANYTVEGYERLGYPGTTPLCIVGHYVYEAFGAEELARIPEGNNLYTYGGPVHAQLKRLGLTDRGIYVLAHIQKYQDTGSSWAEAYEKALDDLTRYRSKD